MPSQVGTRQLVRFATFEVDLHAQELRKAGLRLKLTGQPFQVLAILLERPGTVVTREELQKRLWPDTFVDVDHNLNTAINKIREALGDTAENPRYVETLPRRGYRFIAPVDGKVAPELPSAGAGWRSLPAVMTALCLLLIVLGIAYYKFYRSPNLSIQRALIRLTFDDGLQFGATWSPDSRFIAYSSDRGGKFDIWVQQISGGDPVQVTNGPGQYSQPDWSPDGKFIAYRAEGTDEGLFVIPALGGVGLQRKISSFGYYPKWSPDGAQILFQPHFIDLQGSERLYMVGLDGRSPRELFASDDPAAGPFQGRMALSVAWHPDGKRITFSEFTRGPAPSFWTVPIQGGPPTKLDISPKVLKQLAGVSGAEGRTEENSDWKFTWNSSGTAIYFCRRFGGASNLWRMTVNPRLEKAVSVERLTTGSGFDMDLAVSRDGKNLAFTGKSSFIRAWLFPFDPNNGTVSGVGRPVTSAGMEAWLVALSPDSSRLVFGGNRSGKFTLWQKTVDGGPETPILIDDSHGRYFAQWSPDGTHLAYPRIDLANREIQVSTWSSADHTEAQVTSPISSNLNVSQWSPDGRSLLATFFSENKRSEIWQVPLDANSTGAPTPRKLLSDPSLDLFQANFSPDGRWISFLAVSNKAGGLLALTIYVAPSKGGKWIPITDGKHWDDKPRWSPDGKTVYFISNRGGFFNVWGIHLDPLKGQPIGNPFPVTSFNRPNLMIPNNIQEVELSLSRAHLALTAEQSSGSIWILSNVDR